jgi:hypothetical protein
VPHPAGEPRRPEGEGGLVASRLGRIEPLRQRVRRDAMGRPRTQLLSALYGLVPAGRYSAHTIEVRGGSPTPANAPEGPLAATQRPRANRLLGFALELRRNQPQTYERAMRRYGDVARRPRRGKRRGRRDRIPADSGGARREQDRRRDRLRRRGREDGGASRGARGHRRDGRSLARFGRPQARSSSTRFEGVAMFKRVPHPVARPQAEQAQRRGHRDAAVKPVPERGARPGVRNGAAARPGMNRQERASFTVYVVLAILVVLFLAATGLLRWLGG